MLSVDAVKAENLPKEVLIAVEDYTRRHATVIKE